MEKSERKFKDNDVLFREDEVSDSIFIVVQGSVEITKSGESGPVVLALLGPGEIFGEVGIIDGSARTTNAVAVGDIIVEEIPRTKFIDALNNETGISVSITSKLINRIRQTNERLSFPNRAIANHRKKTGIFSVVNIFKKFTDSVDKTSNRAQIKILSLLSEEQDIAETQQNHIIRSLKTSSHIKIKAQKENLSIDSDLHPDDRFMKLRNYASDALLNSNSDLIIYGEIPEPQTTLHLYFLPANPDDLDRPGFPLSSTVLTLPVDFDSGLSELLQAVALSVIATKAENKRMQLSQALSDALYAAMSAVQNLPENLTNSERTSIQMCYGNAVATLAFLRGTSDLYQVAVQTYRATLEQLSREKNPRDWALTQKHLGASLQALVERTIDEETLRQAATAFEACLKVFRRDSYPIQWASAQNRLGLVLYKLDLKTGEQEILKKSLTAFQAALKVFNRNEFPTRWADVMNNFAQAAQVLGEQLHSAEVLQKAVKASRGALEIRRKDDDPIIWASTQNNLGSGLFLLGKLSNNKKHLEDSANAFSQALDVYTELRAERLEIVARKNLTRVQVELSETHGSTMDKPSTIPTLDWEKSVNKVR